MFLNLLSGRDLPPLWIQRPIIQTSQENHKTDRMKSFFLPLLLWRMIVFSIRNYCMVFDM